MASTADQQVPRMFMLIHKVCLPVVRTYFENVILCDTKYNNNFKTYLEYHKHKIYHLFVHEPCCKCKTGKMVSNRKHSLFKKQFDKIYKIGSPERSHIKYEDDTICKHCCCGLVSNENCSTKELDMTALYAILKTCIPDLDSEHAMWLDKIVKGRHKLCHMSDMIENVVDGIWSDLESSTLALAFKIPPIPLFGETIKTQVELLKAGNYSSDSVRSIVEAIKFEISEQNNNRKREMSDIQTGLQDYIGHTTAASINEIKETFHHVTSTLSSEIGEIVENKSEGILETVEKTKCEIMSGIKELIGVSHESKGVKFYVRYSSESSLKMSRACSGTADEVKETAIESNDQEKHLTAGCKTDLVCPIFQACVCAADEVVETASESNDRENNQTACSSAADEVKETANKSNDHENNWTACSKTGDKVKETEIESNDLENNETACVRAAVEVKETANGSNDQENNETDNSDVYIYWKIKTRECTTEQRTAIIECIIKAANSIDCWFPYKLTHVFDGSVVIGTLLPEDIFKSEKLFENSIRKFLDMFVEVTGISTNVAECIEVEMLISKTPFTVSPFYCRYEIERSFTTDASVQAAQSMSDKMTDAEQFAKDELCYHKITRNRTSFPPGCVSSDQFAIICWRNIGSPIVETIKLSVENYPNVRSCFTFETIDIGYFLRKDARNFRKLICVSTDGFEDMLVSSTHLPNDAETHIVIDGPRFFKEDNYKSSVMDRTLEELTNALGPFCYYACYDCQIYRPVIHNKWAVCFSSSLSTNSKVISIIDMLSNFLKSKHTELLVTLEETRDVRPDVPYILPISHAKCDIARNVKPEYVISMQLDSTILPTSMPNVESVDARNLQDDKWLQQLEQILGTQYWISGFGGKYTTECCGEYSDFALVRKQIEGLSSSFSIHFLDMLILDYLIAFLFKKTEQETSSALIRYINESYKEKIIVLFDHAEIPDQLRDYHIIHASEDDSTTCEEILKAMEDADRSESPHSDDEPGSSSFLLRELSGEKRKFDKDLMEMVGKHPRMTEDKNTGKIKQAMYKTDLEEDTFEVQ